MLTDRLNKDVVCFHCGKMIKTKKYIMYVPSTFAIAIGADFEKAYHTRCYNLTEKQAEKELFT